MKTIFRQNLQTATWWSGEYIKVSVLQTIDGAKLDFLSNLEIARLGNELMSKSNSSIFILQTQGQN